MGPTALSSSVSTDRRKNCWMRQASDCAGTMKQATTSKSIQRSLSDYCAAVFMPSDVVEVRMIPQLRSTWCAAQDLPGLGKQLFQYNRQGQNIYAGVNPRKRHRGTRSEDVLLAR